MSNLLFKIFISLNSIVLTSITVYSKEICPRVCVCDVYEGQKRADCSDQHLVSADVNIAKSVEILNLSENDITEINNFIFQEFSDLVDLSLAKNSIHIIEMFAFVHLEKLRHLDLSDNRIESVFNAIVENNSHLIYMDMSKNKFMMLEDEPILISTSLEFLSLRSSHLTFIYDSFFRHLPKLIDLDLSDNLLITLRSSNFIFLTKLQFLNIEYNSFTCDRNLEQTLQYLKERKVFVKTDKCNRNSKKVMFEKMIMIDSPSKETKEDVEIDLIWGRLPDTNTMRNLTNFTRHANRQKLDDYYAELKINREEELDCLNDEFTSSLCECRQNFISIYEAQDLNIKAIEFRLYAVLYVGIFLGAISGCLLFYIIDSVKKECGKAARKQEERQELRDRIVRNHIEDIRQRRHVDSYEQPLLPSIYNVNRTPQNSINNSPAPRRIERLIEEPSPTAQLLHRLFRDRQAVELTPIPSRAVLRHAVPDISVTPLHIEEPVDEVNENYDNDEISEYASAVSESSTLNIDRSCTPPPAYREIYE